MNYSVDFLPQVEADVQNAYDWYETQSVGLGEDFLLAADATLNLIKRHPVSPPFIHKKIRKLNTKRFPFGVFYIVTGSVITVIAVVHLARHPDTWKQRKIKVSKTS